ncbi:MAG TPA: inositol-3-phosphate synthase, partial [Longimicrobiales bacterium]|nr:inositol-3-phosphate synthase [Longimicrobiales bacterium]
MKQPTEIRPATGKLGVLLPGFGAVATTFVAGVEAARRGIALPVGSLTQMATIRLGKRTEDRTPLIKDFVPLAGLDDLVFGAWDPIPDDGYQSAVNAGVLHKEHHLDPIEDFLSAIKPMPAAFDTNYVKKLNGPNTKKAANKKELAEQIREDIRNFKKNNGCDRVVMVWCGSTEIYIPAGPVHQTLETFEKGMEANDAAIAPSQL